MLLVETLRASGGGSITLRGRSMHPTLQDGWRIHVRALSGHDLRVGEIGVFLHGGNLTIHRLIWRKSAGGKEALIFQGDNNPVREQIAPEAVLGKVVGAERMPGDGPSAPRFPIGDDSRARFYRLAHRSHALLSRAFPSLHLSESGAPPAAMYRLLRGLFRSLERIVSPRPRR